VTHGHPAARRGVPSRRARRWGAVVRVLVPVLVVAIVVVTIYLAALIARMVRRAQWPGDSPQYRNHLTMARWIERQLRDDMVNVTIPQSERIEAKRLLEEFYDAPQQLGEGE